MKLVQDSIILKDSAIDHILQTVSGMIGAENLGYESANEFIVYKGNNEYLSYDKKGFNPHCKVTLDWPKGLLEVTISKI